MAIQSKEFFIVTTLDCLDARADAHRAHQTASFRVEHGHIFILHLVAAIRTIDR